MDSERAEKHLRLLAEAELRGAIVAARESAMDIPPRRVQRVAGALVAAGAIDAAHADAILAGLTLALAVRHQNTLLGFAARGPVVRRRLSVIGTPPAGPPRPRPHPPHRPGARPAYEGPSYVIPVGMMIPLRSDDTRGELYLLAYSRGESGARFAMHAWLRGAFASSVPNNPRSVDSLHAMAASDEHGTAYALRFEGGGNDIGWTGMLTLEPDPPPGIGWLDLSVQGRPARRISLAPPPNPPAITVSEAGRSPGEYLLNLMAAAILTVDSSTPENPGRRRLTRPRYLAAEQSAGLGDIVEALLACGALSPLSPIPGQLVTLCESLDLRDHGIAAPPARELPPPWLSLLSHAIRRKPGSTPPHHGCAAVAVRLPELDGVTLSILGLHSDEDGTKLHVQASGVAADVEPDAAFLPVFWLGDDAGRWHVTQTSGWNTDDGGEASAELQIMPPLAHTSSLEIIMAGRSAEIRTTLPLRWR